jgi:dipeptidyl aminopeptidase/acylaminoacyl peptidase
MEQLIQFPSFGHIIKGRFQSPHRNAPCIVMSHGFESSMDGNKWQLLVPWFSARGFATLRFNYRGCGEGTTKSEGAFEETTLSSRIADYHGGLDFLQGTDVDTQRIGVIGSSFGATIILAAPDERIKVLVALAAPYAFPPLAEEEQAHLQKQGYLVLPSGNKLGVGFFRDLEHYDVLQQVRQIGKPVLIIHGSQDEVVPIENARAIYAASAGVKKLEIIEGADHSFTDYRYCGQIMNMSYDWFENYL